MDSSASDALPRPCALSSGRLSVDGVELGEITPGLEGHAVWLLSHGALRERIEACDGPRTVSVGRVGTATVLSLLASAGWWARCHSTLELERAQAAGFPESRLVASGRVKDDGCIGPPLGERRQARLSIGRREIRIYNWGGDKWYLLSLVEIQPWRW